MNLLFREVRTWFNGDDRLLARHPQLVLHQLPLKQRHAAPRVVTQFPQLPLRERQRAETPLLQQPPEVALLLQATHTMVFSHLSTHTTLLRF